MSTLGRCQATMKCDKTRTRGRFGGYIKDKSHCEINGPHNDICAFIMIENITENFRKITQNNVRYLLGSMSTFDKNNGHSYLCLRSYPMATLSPAFHSPWVILLLHRFRTRGLCIATDHANHISAKEDATCINFLLLCYPKTNTEICK